MIDFSDFSLSQLMDIDLAKMDAEELVAFDEALEELTKREAAKAARNSLLEFCVKMNPDYKIGAHHRRLAKLLEDMAFNRKDRIAVSIPPRHGKSFLVSVYFPAWFLGNFPDKKVLMVSHTTDLAVDFGRKVRNLVDQAVYKEIFPTVTLAADSKSAGRWNTNMGGEYFACLRRYALIATTRGAIPAGQVVVGDRLLNCGKPVTVQEVYNSQHKATYKIGGLDCSEDHPIWTMNRGWVYAKNIVPSDILCTESIPDRMKALIRRSYGYLEHTIISQVVQHQVSLHKSQQREVGTLWRSWDYAMQKMACVREFLNRHGATALTPIYSWANRQQWPVFSRELSVGNSYRTSQQQTEQPNNRGENPSPACTQYGYDPRSGSVSSIYRDEFDYFQKEKKELWTYSPPENLGWARRAAVRLFTSSSENNSARNVTESPKGYMASIGETAQKLLGLFLGVRRARYIHVIEHIKATPFVNFLTDGDHTFFADGVLTHNCGVGSALAGRGADFLIVDDPFSEQDILNGNYEVFQKAYEWFTFGARTRLMPQGRIAIVHTRWHPNDLIGAMAKDMARNDDADKYEFFEFPAVFNEGTEDEKALWPEFFDLEALKRTKASMPIFQWNAQYQQNPTAEEGAIVRREWWKAWEKEDPPDYEYVIMTLDAAAEKNNRADFSAILTWGVFSDDNITGGASHIILLNAINVRVEFPELKDIALREYNEWGPDAFIVEKKSNGTPLFQEFRRMGIPVSEFTPHRGTGDKVARLNAIADVFRSGMVWYPANRRWAEEVVEQVAAFPASSNDDMVDCTSMAIQRFRSGGFISLNTDHKDDSFSLPRVAKYY